MPERAELQSGQHGLDECDAANGTRVVVSHLLVLETASVLGQSAQQQSTKGDNPGGSGSAHGSSSAQTAAMAPLTFQPGALERSYWAWRVRYDLLQVDLAFLAFSASQALLIASRDGGSGRDAMALLLLACFLQLACMVYATPTYISARTPLLCVIRSIHILASCLTQRALQGQLESGGLQAVSGSGELRISLVQAVLACTGIGRLLVHPIGLQLPFRVALPFQVLEFLLARAGGAVALRHATRFLEVGRHLGTALHLVHDTLDGLFHVSTALLFPGAYDISLLCSPSAVELLVLFLQLLCGCLLPLYCIYVGELTGKVRYVQRWAARQGLGVRSGEQRSRIGAGSSSSGSAADAVVGSGSGDADVDVSSHSAGSWPSSRSGGERGCVYLELQGPVQLLELESVSEGRVVAPHTHAAWLLLLVVVAWGLTSQLQNHSRRLLTWGPRGAANQ